MNRRNVLLGLAALAGVGLAVGFLFLRPQADSGEAPLAIVQAPVLEGAAAEGAEIFKANCARCHGANAAGREGLGPPLIHRIYEPGHHSDDAFRFAVRMGSRAHHWPFGDMPPVENVSEQEVERIIAYVRTLQRANGIY